MSLELPITSLVDGSEMPANIPVEAALPGQQAGELAGDRNTHSERAREAILHNQTLRRLKHHLKRLPENQALAEGEPHKLRDLIETANPEHLQILFEPGNDILWQARPHERLGPIWSAVGQKFCAIAEQAALAHDRSLNEAERNLVFAFFDKFGFDLHETSSIVNAWWALRPDAPRREKLRTLAEARFDAVSENLQRMIALGPDTSRILHRRFGIRNFRRYSESTLFRQATTRPGPTSGPSVVVSDAYDWNNALADAGIVGEQALREPVFLEASTMAGAIRRMIQVARERGPIQRAIFNVHADKSVIGNDGENIITQARLQTLTWMAELVPKRVLSPDATCILSACNTGRQGGIATTLAEVTSLPVIASVGEIASTKVTDDGRMTYHSQSGRKIQTIRVTPDGKRETITGHISVDL